MLQASKITVPNRKRRERYPSAMKLESPDCTYETDDRPLPVSKTAMMEQEGRSVPTKYLQTGSESSDQDEVQKEAPMLMYGRNTRTDTRITAQKIGYEDRVVRL